MAALQTRAQGYGYAQGVPALPLAAHAGQAPAAAPAVPAAAAAAVAAPPAAETVPDIVEDNRTDEHGNIVVRRYQRGRLLGKVRRAAASRSGGGGGSAGPPRARARARRPHAPRALPRPIPMCRAALRAASSSRG